MLQSYNRGERSIQDIQTEIASLLEAALDLVLEFQYFLPDSAGTVDAEVDTGRPGTCKSDLVGHGGMELDEGELNEADSDDHEFDDDTGMRDGMASQTVGGSSITDDNIREAMLETSS